MKGRKDMKFEQLLQLVDAVSESALTEFKYEENGVKVCLKKSEQEREIQITHPVPTHTCEKSISDSEQVIESKRTEGKVIKSPLVGTFYVAPSEGADPFVKVGDSVEEGQVLAIVEAMKLMNEIESEYAGTIREVLVENGNPVEYGQPLFILE